MPSRKYSKKQIGKTLKKRGGGSNPYDDNDGDLTPKALAKRLAMAKKAEEYMKNKQKQTKTKTKTQTQTRKTSKKGTKKSPQTRAHEWANDNLVSSLLNAMQKGYQAKSKSEAVNAVLNNDDLLREIDKNLELNKRPKGSYE